MHLTDRVNKYLPGLITTLPVQPMMRAFNEARFNPACVKTVTECLKPNEWTDNEAYKALNKPLGIPYHAALMVVAAKNLFIPVSVFRSRGEFKPAELERLRGLWPVLKHCSDVAQTSSWLSKGIKHSNGAIISANDAGEILFISDSAEELLSQYLKIQNVRKLPPQVQQRFVDDVSTNKFSPSSNGDPVRIVDLNRNGHTVRVYRITCGGLQLLALFKQETKSDEPRSHLTSTQVALLDAAFRNKANRQICEELCRRSPRTVYCHR